MKLSSQPNQNGHYDEMSLADELRQESERLCNLAAKLKAREEELSEMEANYPYFKRFVYDTLKAEALKRPLDEIPGDDLEAYAKSIGAVELDDSFFDDWEKELEL